MRDRNSPELLGGGVQGGADNRAVTGINSVANPVSTIEAVSALHMQALIQVGRQMQQ